MDSALKKKEYSKKLDLKTFPEPFNHPDLVVFEGFYDVREAMFAKKLVRLNIPYVIIPRGSLTHQSLNNHSKWKKKIAHWLIFNQYAYKADAIQYLTNDEYKDSGDRWNKQHIIIPNGFSTPERTKSIFNSDKIKATFIGRLDLYHKGLDVLIDACDMLQRELRNAGFELCLYGPRRYQHDLIAQMLDEKGLNDIITLGGETSGKAKEKVLLDSDLFVLTSRFEGHPMGLIEALAYGVPAIVTPGSNMAAEIRKSNSGWTCKDVTVEEISKMLRQMIAERNQLPVKSLNAMKLAEPYDWDKLAAKFHEEAVKLLHG